MGEKSGAGGAGGGRERAMETKAPSTPSRGTVFGVDGVSKTGSTARDAAIGFTAGEGTGKAGSNFAALSGATREQTDKAVAAAQAAQRAGESPQRAAAEAIGAPAPINPIARALGLDSPYARPTTAADEAAFDAFLADEVTGAPIPESRISVRSSTPAQAFMDNMQFGIDTLADIKAKHDADAELFGMTPSTSAVDRAIKAGKKVGIAAAPMATAQAVLGQTPDELSVEPFGGIGSTNLSGMIDEAVAAENQVGAYGVTPTGQSLANQGMAYSSPVQDPITGNYEINGVPVDTAFAEQVIADRAKAIEAMPSPSAGLFGNVLGYTGIGKLSEMLTGKTIQERAAEAYGKMLAMPGAEVDAAGNITAPAGRGTLNYSQTLGGITYRGMPDASYTGPFANLVNPPEQERGGGETMTEAVVEEAVNPCPDGYTLVDGVCQPTADVTAPDTRFTLPATPMSFQPMTQATPVQQINPFVLSPTGAALGRQI